MASCHPLFSRNPSLKLGNIKYATALQSNTDDPSACSWLEWCLTKFSSWKLKCNPPLPETTTPYLFRYLERCCVGSYSIPSTTNDKKQTLVKNYFSAQFCATSLKCPRKALVKILTGSRKKVSAQEDYIFFYLK